MEFAAWVGALLGRATDDVSVVEEVGDVREGEVLWAMAGHVCSDLVGVGCGFELNPSSIFVENRSNLSRAIVGGPQVAMF